MSVINLEESWKAYNDLLMKGPLDRFTKIFARYDLYKQVIDRPGDIVECGVFKGAGVLFWAKLIQLFNPLSNRKVIGFDTFEGYPEQTGAKDKEAGKKFIDDSSYDPVSPEQIMEIAKRQNLDGRIELVKGDASKTVFEFADKNPGFRIALLNLDFDVYEPTKAALESLYPRVIRGGIVALDEYAIKKWGESNALDEYMKDKKLDLKAFSWAYSPTAYFKKE